MPVTLSNRIYRCKRHDVEGHRIVEGEKCAPCTLIGGWIMRDVSGLNKRTFLLLAAGLRGEGLMIRERVK
jgi:hypothetical protein